MEPKLKNIEVEKIKISTANTRRIDPDVDTDKLAESLKSDGLIQPIVVLDKDGEFELIVGQRRLRAAKKAGLQKIKAFVHEKMTEGRMRHLSFVENIERVGLNPADESAEVARLYTELGSEKAVAKKIRRSIPWVISRLNIQALPDPVRKLIEEGRLGITEAGNLVQLLVQNPDMPRNRIIEYANMIVTTKKRSKIRSKMFRVLREKSDIPPSKLKATAEGYRPSARINFPISSAVSEALNNASKDAKLKPGELVHGIIYQWLLDNGYLKPIVK